ncbi:MAG TPA: hypothetical protein VK588_00425 [Chitinophagaceae bacterium]|nr:hypothetical protein [Chitinophagaceae bacterium]
MQSQIDINTVRETFRQMGNAELLAFAEQDGMNISTGAYHALKEEMLLRGIGKQMMDRIDHGIILNYALKQKELIGDANRNLFAAALEYALTAKKDGATQYEIYAGLIERGVPDDYANYMINNLDQWARTLQSEAVTTLQAGIALVVLGVLISWLTITIGQFIFAGPVVLLIGLIRMVTGFDRRKKYKKILQNLQDKM